LAYFTVGDHLIMMKKHSSQLHWLK